MADFDPRTAHKPAPPPSEAVKLEVEALRSMLGLPPEKTEHPPPERLRPDDPIPPDRDPTNQP